MEEQTSIYTATTEAVKILAMNPKSAGFCPGRRRFQRWK
jgi:hypothetical protein